MYIENIRKCHIDIICNGSYKNMTIGCEYRDDSGLHNISMKFPYTKYEIRRLDGGITYITDILAISISDKEIIIVCRVEYGDMCVITIKR